MSNQVYVNPEEIGKFINEIKVFLDTLNSATNRLNGKFNDLSSSWKDSKRAEFKEQYDKLLEFLKMFEESSKEKIQYLEVLKKKAEDYLGS